MVRVGQDTLRGYIKSNNEGRRSGNYHFDARLYNWNTLIQRRTTTYQGGESSYHQLFRSPAVLAERRSGFDHSGTRKGSYYYSYSYAHCGNKCQISLWEVQCHGYSHYCGPKRRLGYWSWDLYGLAITHRRTVWLTSHRTMLARQRFCID